MLTVCMFTVLFGPGQLISVLFPGEVYLSHSQLFSVVYSSLCKVEADHGLFSVLFGMSIGVFLVLVYCLNPFWQL